MELSQKTIKEDSTKRKRATAKQSMRKRTIAENYLKFIEKTLNLTERI
jgi:hypothetical protein